MVIDEHTLGVIMSNGRVQVLHASVLRGATWGSPAVVLLPMDKKRYRDATEKDFRDFRVSSRGYDTKE